MKTKLTFLTLFLLSLLSLLTLPMLILPTHAQGPDDLTIDKTVTLTNDPAQPGDLITYTLFITNSGTATATDVVITDTLPSEVDGDDFAVTTSIPASSTISYTLNATVSTTISPGVTITNTAYVSAAAASGQDSVTFTTATTAAFEILKPTTLNPAYAGPITDTQKIIVRVTKPEAGLTTGTFTVTIGGISATIVTLYEGSDEYVLEVVPPTQPANGLYDLSVEVVTSTGTETDTETEAVYYNDTYNVDVMLVIDRSGSMEFEDNITKAKDAASQFVTLMNEGDLVGVASFSDTATLNYTLTQIMTDTKTEVMTAINPITEGGFTSIGGGLEIAQSQLISNGQALDPWAIVLLSDGLENRAPFVADVLPGIVGTKTVVHTIALGSLADQLLMQEIAAQTTGTYNFSPTGTELAGIYNTIAGEIMGQQMLVLQEAELLPGATEEIDVVVDSTLDQATFSVSWPSGSGTLELTLEDPSGTPIDQAVAAANADVDFVEGATYQYYKVVSPTLVAGTWKMIVNDGTFAKGTVTSAQADGVPYTAQAFSDSSITLRTYIDQLHFNPGDDIKISVSLSDDQPITGVTVQAVVGPLFTASPLAGQSGPLLTLLDDGAHGDGLANDGVYAATLSGDDTTNEGTYTFNVFVYEGTSNQGQTFDRRDRVNVLVGSDAPPFVLSDTFGFTYLPLIMK